MASARFQWLSTAVLFFENDAVLDDRLATKDDFHLAHATYFTLLEAYFGLSDSEKEDLMCRDLLRMAQFLREQAAGMVSIAV
jgi:hypothetical protein